MTKSFEWTSFIRKIYIKAPLNEVYQMWVNPKNITKFWLSEAEYFSGINGNSIASDKATKGVNYIWKFYSDLTMKGEIIEAKEDELLKFTFGHKYQDSEEKVIVTLAFQSIGNNETLIELIQENIGDDERGQIYYYLSCQLGWLFALNNLKSVMENNFDLRETETKRAHETVGINFNREDSIFSKIQY